MRFHPLTLSLLFTAGSLSAQAPPVPPAYQDLYNTLSTQISAFDTTVSAGWNGSSYPYLDAPQLQAASSDEYTSLLATYYYSVAVTEQLEVLQALGANAVTVHVNFPIFYQPYYTWAGNPSQYQQFVSFYQQLVQDIRARGMKVVIEASVGLPLVGNQLATAFQPYFNTLTWSEYLTGRADNVLAVAQLLQPDYMTVLTEPDTEATVSGQTNVQTVSGATQLVQQVLTTLEDAGVTGIQIGAGAGTWMPDYPQWVQAFTSLPLNFVDMHIYPINESYFTAALSAADTIHAAGMQVGLSECWDLKIRNDELGVLSYSDVFSRDPFSFWQPVDTSFLEAIVNFAQYKQLAFIGPYWVNYFFAYLDYNTYGSLPQSTVLTDSYAASGNAALVGAFTPTGHAWESMNIPPDTTAPATPAAPTAPTIGTVGFNLQWAADTDNVGVSAYNLYRDGTLLGTTSGLVYYDNGLVSGETYTYNLTATDASGNVSGMSPPLVVETVDITPPSVPTNLAVTSFTYSSVSLNWTPSTGIGGVGGYWILRGTSPGSMAIQAGVTAPPYTDPYARPSTTYYYEVESYNPLGVVSATSNQVSATSPAANCSYSVGNLPAGSIPGAGGTVTLSVIAAAGCNWMAYSGSSAAIISSGSSGVGNGSVSITFGANTTGSTINLALTIAGQVIDLTQAVDPPLAFYTLAPCRIADTRAGNGFSDAFGPPSLIGGATRNFPIPSSSCNVPSNAQAYSFNITVLPHTTLGYLTAWPTGESFPTVSTLNSMNGQVVANAAIVPAGTSGAISVFASDETDLLIDINGYFAAPGSPQALAFYPMTPCRVADTRSFGGFSGAFGPPSMTTGEAREFPVTSSSCNIPGSAQAYSLNMTASPVTTLGYLTTWPTGGAFPNVSTLNDLGGGLLANAAIVPAGTSGDIEVYVSNATDVIIDIDGYFAPPGSTGALNFYTLTPCRVADTRSYGGKTGAFGPPTMTSNSTRNFPMLSSSCGIPDAAQAYSLNMTAWPPGSMEFLTTWPVGQTFPTVSTLNAPSGQVVANAAIVPAGTGGDIDVYVSNTTDIFFDINGYFAP